MFFDGLEFSLLKREDVSVLTPVMKRAFDDDSRLFFDRPEGGPDGYDDGSFLEKWGFAPDATAYIWPLRAAWARSRASAESVAMVRAAARNASC